MQNENEKKKPTLEELYRAVLEETGRSYDSDDSDDDDDDGCIYLNA